MSAHARVSEADTRRRHGRPLVAGADGLHRLAFTAGDVGRMVELGILGADDPFELVEGELIEMSPKGFTHDRVRDELAMALIRALPGEFAVSVEGTLQLGPGTLVEPDLLAYRKVEARSSDQEFKTVPGPRILLAVEVSVTSLAYDRGRKAALYAGAGVPDYWICDLAGSRVLVHRQPTGGHYRSVREVAAAEIVRPLAPDLAGISIRLADLL